MAWSDAARRAAAEARRLRATRMMGAKINDLSPGQKNRIKQDRQKFFRRFREGREPFDLEAWKKSGRRRQQRHLLIKVK